MSSLGKRLSLGTCRRLWQWTHTHTHRLTPARARKHVFFAYTNHQCAYFRIICSIGEWNTVLITIPWHSLKYKCIIRLFSSSTWFLLIMTGFVCSNDEVNIANGRMIYCTCIHMYIGKMCITGRKAAEIWNKKNVTSLAVLYLYFHGNCSIDYANCIPPLLLRPRCRPRRRLSFSLHHYTLLCPNL